MVTADGYGNDAGLGLLLLRAPALVALVRALFEEYWASRRCPSRWPPARRRTRATSSGRCWTCSRWA